mmetsp:Transcript_20008/g.40782  ORF Transcript_20008/g.40782 Transcript_20008/m.40782 type:complete len:130 (-) Transcript_20008:99-488(-)
MRNGRFLQEADERSQARIDDDPHHSQAARSVLNCSTGQNGAQPCMSDSKKPPRPRCASFGIGCTTRLHVHPNISQSGLRQQISPTTGHAKLINTPQGVHDGQLASLVPPSFVQMGSQHQFPDFLYRAAI